MNPQQGKSSRRCARHSLGLTTRLVNSKLGDHSCLSENTVDRVRKLAGTFIEGVQSRLGIKIGSDHALGTWEQSKMLILRKSWEARHLCAYRWSAGSAQQVHQKNRSRLVQILTHTQKLQCLCFVGVPNQIWRQNLCHQEKSRSIASCADRHSSRTCNVEVQG